MPPKIKKPKYILEMEEQLKSLTAMVNSSLRDQTSESGGPSVQGSGDKAALPVVPPEQSVSSSGRGKVLRSGKATTSVDKPSVPKQRQKKAPSATQSKPPADDTVTDHVVVESPEDGAGTSAAGGEDQDMVLLNRPSIAETIQDVVDPATANTGDCLEPFLPAGTTLESKIKRRIVSGEYVDLSTLQHKNEPTQQFFNGQLNISALHSKPRQPATFVEWMRLFLVYASIYGSSHPDQAVPMMSYILRIHGLYARTPVTYAWRAYDEEFRRIRAHCPTLAWHYIHQNILSVVEENLNVQNMTYKRKNNTAGKGEGSKPGGKGTKQGCCYAYNDISKICSRPKCSFLHRCQACLGAHPVYQCSSAGSKQDNRPKGTGGMPRPK